MPYVNSGSARIYFIEQGVGFPVITVHGLIENTAYWRLPGVADRLAREFHVVSMDMRAHGNTRIQGEDPGFDAETVAADIISLADHLGFERFHLVAHSTGGFAAVRHAIKDCSRFASLVLTNTGSFTSPIAGDPERIRKWHEALAQAFETQTWEEMFGRIRKKPGPFFRGIVESRQAEEMLEIAYEMVRQNNREEIAAFVRSFYTDPDPRREELSGIDCPVLIIYGEKDELFIGSSQLMAAQIPDARLLMYEGVGHMTAIEAPERLSRDIRAFLRGGRLPGPAAGALRSCAEIFSHFSRPP